MWVLATTGNPASGNSQQPPHSTAPALPCPHALAPNTRKRKGWGGKAPPALLFSDSRLGFPARHCPPLPAPTCLPHLTIQPPPPPLCPGRLHIHTVSIHNPVQRSTVHTYLPTYLPAYIITYILRTYYVCIVCTHCTGCRPPSRHA